ncbi:MULTISPECIES: arginyltransferase [unclassified Ruegeria]|uniref:arginyltransferase n=1 Tax=unclassified Ruegeria TaxID=2625375 RepID=UPI0014889056|nr:MULTISPECIES: arginyltransferase [unclassified Ruegeria]NOD77271.1 arginyltransferase [Ruegeria sp. HKCCD4332]NOD87694.1 arginyltransferase [Ruegeria sp. HKCCD4318]NOD91790.1 arginyltransferase [Ruegeria sp. HKCCD4884]NOE14064.1 arginyltransferase [Ruegeria sp. HKCCD4318-2]NOG08579.1 arginyltransferase [Ruegeria sp. HKCCD4315]
MRHTLPIAPQFYVTAPQPCPYLDGRMERKLFTALQGEGAEQLNNSLSQQGFRRSQNVLYRPSCTDCAACLSARIDVSAFRATKSQKRAAKRNGYLERRATSPWATDEQYELFRRYLDTRHADGGMADMDVFEFAAMIEETPIRSRVVEYADPKTGDLIAVSLTDVLDDGLSMVYSFYDPNQPQNSLGTYMILDHIDIAREAGLPYIYLGYWVPGSPKMGYKAKFSGLEAYIQGQWQKIKDPDAFSDASHHPLSSAPIAEQVANIQLPDRHPTKG